MAKKKKGKRHRQPVAPPIHSAPSTYIPRVPSGDAPPARPSGVEPPTGSAAPPEAAATRSVEAPRRVRQTPAQRRQAAQKRARRRNWLIAGTLIVLLVGGLVVQRVFSSRANREFSQLARAAGCGETRETSTSGAQEHLGPGETTKYDTSPPTHGEHAPATLRAGIYDEPLSEDPGENNSIYRAVHSLEHGAVIVWHDGLKDADLDELDSQYRSEEKVLVVPYPDLKGDTNVALTAWGRIAECEKASPAYIDAFVDRYRSARSAPEANVPL